MSAESRKHFVINNFVHGLKLFIADFCSSIDLALSFELILKNNQTVVINFLGEENPDEVLNNARHSLPPPPPLPRDLNFPVVTTTTTATSSSSSSSTTAAPKSNHRHLSNNKANNQANGSVNNDAPKNGREDPRRPGSGGIVPLGVPPPPAMGVVHSPIGIPAPQNIPLPLGVPPPPLGAIPPPAGVGSSSNQGRPTEQTVFGHALRYTAKENEEQQDENRGWVEPENWRKRIGPSSSGVNNNNNNQSKNKNDIRPPALLQAHPSKAEEKKRRSGGNDAGAAAAEGRADNLDSTVNYLFDELELEDTPRKRKSANAAAAIAAHASMSTSKAIDVAASGSVAEAETPSPPDAKRRVRFEKKEGFICSKCGQFFNRFRNYYLHQVKRHDKKKKDEILEGIKDKKFKCPDCLFSSDCKREIDKHRKKYHHDLYKCSECTFSTYTRTKLNEHAQIYH